MAKNKINLVTGATGFLGSHLVEELLRRKKTVRVFVRETSDLEFLKQFDLETIYGCLSDLESLIQATKDVETIFHCAAFVSDYGPFEEFERANVTGVENILKCALINKPERIVHISTTDVYGFPKGAVDENYPFKKRGFFYGETKIDGEKIIWDYYEKHKIPITVFRPATIYGERSLFFIDEIISMLKKKNYIHIRWKDVDAGLVHVSNLIDAIFLALDSPDSIGEAYNIIDGNKISFRRLAKSLAVISESPEAKIFIPFTLAFSIGFITEKLHTILNQKDRPFLTRMAACLFGISQEFSTEKIQKELHWKPKITFEEGIERIRKSKLI